jgi:hypothetical protein
MTKPVQRVWSVALYRVQSFWSVLRASFSSRWHAGASRPGKPATSAAGRRVRSTSNFGTEFAAKTICEAVYTIDNSAGMISSLCILVINASGGFRFTLARTNGAYGLSQRPAELYQSVQRHRTFCDDEHSIGARAKLKTIYLACKFLDSL